MVLLYPHMFLNIGKNKYVALVKIRVLQSTVPCLEKDIRKQVRAQCKDVKSHIVRVTIRHVVGGSVGKIMLGRENN